MVAPRGSIGRCDPSALVDRKPDQTLEVTEGSEAAPSGQRQLHRKVLHRDGLSDMKAKDGLLTHQSRRIGQHLARTDDKFECDDAHECGDGDNFKIVTHYGLASNT